ncbi:MAG: HPr family phosphocarrier protein [Ruminococcus sp.]|nr:HPr family phosphocarrier protein [Ruminococcus sp.]
MKNFTYIIKDETGIHARPAGMLVKCAQGFKSDIKIEKDGKSADAKKLFGIMGLAVKCGNEVKVSCAGEDEAEASAELEKFFKDNL